MNSPQAGGLAKLVLAIGIFVFPMDAVAQLQNSTGLFTQQEISRSYLQQNLGAMVPANAQFMDDRGRPVRMADYFSRLPTLLVLGYFTCPDLCPMTFRNVTEELNGVGPQAGRDFQVIVISFDPRDTPAVAANQKEACLLAYKWPARADGWHFLTGRQPAIDAVTRAVGFHYTYDQAQGRYIHPTGVMVLTPAGRLSHYFFGVDASPADLESALHDAAAGRATTVDQVVQEYCANYDPTLTFRGRKITRVINSVCIAFAGAFFGYIAYEFAAEMFRRRSRAPNRGSEVAP
ncbi:MAG TPA: SCO family protein [Tepidisphaeraceae bacterium]|nr:SCO family protein [Tepidisphaeraceae bacterium]